MINRLTALFILINRCLRIISFCWSLSLFSAIILKAEEKSCWLFVEGTCWPVQKCVIPAALYWKTENYKTLIFCFHLPCRTQRRCIISTRRSWRLRSRAGGPQEPLLHWKCHARSSPRHMTVTERLRMVIQELVETEKSYVKVQIHNCSIWNMCSLFAWRH